MKKTVVINRGVIGSGKSEIAKRISKFFEKNSLDVAIHSTDDFFIKNGKYKFNIEKLESYHKKNIENFKESLERGVDLVVVDNTNLMPWEVENYTKLARDYGYQVVLINFEPREYKEHLKVAKSKIKSKNEREKVVRRMLENYKRFNSLLDKNSKIDSCEHIQNRWDLESKTFKTIGVADYFDYDKLIDIKSEDFKKEKKRLPEKLFKLITEGFENKKRAVVTILGTAGVKFNRSTGAYDIASKAKYIFGKKSYKYHNMFPLLYKKYSKKYEIIALYTEEAKKAQELVLEAEGINLKFDDRFLIDNPKDIEKFFHLINQAIRDYDSVVFDVSHGFRHLPILAIINLIIENIENPNKIEKILFTKEVKQFKKYEVIDLKKYLDIANIAFAMRSFLSTYKVPSLKLESKIYKDLTDFSTDLTSNRFQKLFSSDIKELKESIANARENYFFLENLLDNLEEFISSIESIEGSKEYEKFIFFSKIFLDKEYLLNSATYLIEGIVYYVGTVLKDIGVLDRDFDLNIYRNRQDVVAILELSTPAKSRVTLPNEYFIDINYKLLSDFNELRKEVGDIRNNLAHININKSYGDLSSKLEKLISRFESLIIRQELDGLDLIDTYKTETVKYILEKYQKETDKFFSTEVKPKISTILNKHRDNNIDRLQGISEKNREQLNKFILANINNLSKLLEYVEQKILRLSRDEALELSKIIKPSNPENGDSSQSNTKKILNIKVLPKSELKEANQSVRKPIEKINQQNSTQSVNQKSINSNGKYDLNKLIKIYDEKIKSFLLKNNYSQPRLDTIVKKYDENLLLHLNSFNIIKLKVFLETRRDDVKNIERIREILEHKKNNNFRISKATFDRLMYA